MAPLISGHSDLAIGTRLARTSRVVRGPKRELISRSYNLLLKATMRSGFCVGRPGPARGTATWASVSSASCDSARLAGDPILGALLRRKTVSSGPHTPSSEFRIWRPS